MRNKQKQSLIVAINLLRENGLYDYSDALQKELDKNDLKIEEKEYGSVIVENYEKKLKDLLKKREDHRIIKNYEEADELRNEIENKGNFKIIDYKTYSVLIDLNNNSYIYSY